MKTFTMYKNFMMDNDTRKVAWERSKTNFIVAELLQRDRENKKRVYGR